MAYSGVQRRTANRRVQDTYVVGNTVRKLNIVEELQNPVQQKPVNHTVRKNRENI